MAKDNKGFFKVKNSWSDIKDQLLGCYLAPYFQKVLMTNQPIFYVDCFAGKGKFEDGKPGSPLIALQARDDCLLCTSLKTGHGQIDACFIDLNYANDLKCNIADFCNSVNRTQVVSGKYEEIIEGLLSSKSGTNVFLYIDPYGISESTRQGFSSLNYAACHDCVLLPETSCEFRNVLLDRISVVGLPENRRMGFMGELAQSL